MAADVGHWTSTSELSFTVPANSVFLRKRNFGPIKRTDIHPVRHARPASRLHEDVAEPSSLLLAEDIARSNVKHEKTLQRLHFHKREHQESEAFATYVSALRRSGETCGYGAMLNEMICDRVVCGEEDVKVQDPLLFTKNLDLQTPLELATAAGAA
ncbi:hypothetical protein HPB47_026464 [Ixodes persulcatus]|uniref:Uncharacterized protein n=1 Tax=Ixodes persulcatus TaxID=34615 RepID=A0AC60PYM3_IXOPE|nr:hypothetical protein HPB47_026464 [Ixodes persulcatus]